ncbi:RCC1 repeat-containing protein [Sphaceloma murrayae]|uniref:RCC1 repeat-containing protein n=1 Tax=Sphaceloma murrayae TaxID=2082308 RepID=A0A2K1QW81_9PEZI|nr:RCC1 repeat-containing protein [Sphaceloma murrayae]
MPTTFSDLPLDILHLITAHLDVPTFLSLTSTCHSLSSPTLSQSSAFWLSAVHATFRVPNQPVVSHDGLRWKKLYKRLLTQTRPYTWGSNSKGQLGHSFLSSDEIHAIPPAERMRRARRARQVSWPETMETEGGIIADLQAGGWSTTYLTSKGHLYTAGVIDGQRIWGNPPRPQAASARPEKLRFPPGWTGLAERGDRETAVGQFSAGRAHVLGLSDAGRIWSWWDAARAGVMVKLLGIDLNERGHANGTPLVKRVVAGWNKSAALVKGKGIVVWEPVDNSDEQEDTALVLESAVVPQTGYERGSVSGPRRVDGTSPDEEIGEVLDFVVLEHCIIFNTHHGRVFASWIGDGSLTMGELLEIHPHVDEDGIPPSKDEEGKIAEADYVTDVQGTFRSFALFLKSGEVLNGTQDLVNDWKQDIRSRTVTQFTRVPALQNTGVIKLAFGDYHFLALHKDGYITSYGTESQACGSLGLGGNRDPEGRLRGIRYAGLAGDGKLVPHAYTTGRRVWFEPEKRQWIKFLASGGTNPEEARERIRMCSETVVQAEVSEWIEQEGNSWEEKYACPPAEEDVKAGNASMASFRTAQETSDDSLSPYFALSVTAAGWHSGALVLVNGPVADRIRSNCIINEPLPFAEPESQAQATPTQQEQGILSHIYTNILWFLGLTPPGPVQYGHPDDPIFANPRIRFPPHRPDPTRQMPPREYGHPPPALPDAQEENVWDPNDDPHRQTPPPPQPGAAPVPGPTNRPGPIVGHGPARRIQESREEAQARARAQQAADARRYEVPRQEQGQGQPVVERPRRAFADPVNHGAAPDKESRWIWAYDPFPRLRLSDGREMPGEVDFAEWRKGRPEWDLAGGDWGN